ncbi:MAG: glycosyltransferase family 4 protein [Phycisphaerales bacterium]
MNPRASTIPRADPTAPPIAHTLVVVSCAYTALTTGERFGLLDRERAFYARLWPNFRQVVFVSYGGAQDHAVAEALVHAMSGRVRCVCNDADLEPGVFLAGVPDRVARLASGADSALILTEQFWGGDVAVTITNCLRHNGLRVGLAARGGYHWSWTMLREHGPDSPQFAQARYLEGELCRAADIVIATTPRILDDLAFQHALPRSRLRLVPNFVLTDADPAPVPARKPGLVLTAGRLAREKRVGLLIEAVATLSASVPNLRLLVVGDGPESDALVDLARRLNAPVEFRARVPHHELLGLMRACRVYAQCSEYEGHPKTVLEAMSSAAPVLVTDSPGLADRVHPGRTGLVTPATAEPIAAALHTLLSDDALAETLGRAASAAVRAELGLDAVYPLYRRACADAMSSAGAFTAAPPPIVRWDQPLLNLAPPAAAAAWHAGLHAFAKRLGPAAARAFREDLLARLTGHAPATNDRA